MYKLHLLPRTGISTPQISTGHMHPPEFDACCHTSHHLEDLTNHTKFPFLILFILCYIISLPCELLNGNLVRGNWRRKRNSAKRKWACFCFFFFSFRFASALLSWVLVSGSGLVFRFTLFFKCIVSAGDVVKWAFWSVGGGEGIINKGLVFSYVVRNQSSRKMMTKISHQNTRHHTGAQKDHEVFFCNLSWIEMFLWTI